LLNKKFRSEGLIGFFRVSAVVRRGPIATQRTSSKMSSPKRRIETDVSGRSKADIAKRYKDANVLLSSFV